MAKTFLGAVNDVLKYVNVLKGDQSDLTSFTDSAHQRDIDRARRLWNEVIQDIFTLTPEPLSQEGATTTVTLSTGTREYALPSDFEQMRWPLIDSTNQQTIREYPGGYDQMRKDQLSPSQWKGLPYFAAINYTTNQLRVDREPTADENGNQYTMWYDKRLSLSTTAETFVFSDTVVESLTPAVGERMQREDNREGTTNLIRESFRRERRSMGRAMRLLTQSQQRTKW